ncbi:MAG: hypothetical protein K0R78_2295 [Pelosinus sp.]|jgi:hypothetical protein|nr:hypothetical protein [Pelosinus sp.]
MNNLFLLVFLLSMVLLIIGLIKPSLVIRWGDTEKRGRKQVFLTFFGLAVVSFIAFGVTTDNKKATSSQSSSQTTQAPAEKPSVKTYKPGQYKVGTDIPAGEYVAIAKSDAYIEIASDATGTMGSILANDIFLNRSIISIADGQYLKVQNGQLYAIKDAPKPQEKDGFLPAGMYKIGLDLPAGEYKIISEGGDSYIEVSGSSSHSMHDIISNDIFQGDKYIKVSDGQYLKIFRAKIKTK